MHRAPMTRPVLDHSPHKRPTARVSVARCPQTYLYADAEGCESGFLAFDKRHAAQTGQALG